MRLEDMMTSNFATLSPEDSLKTAVRRLRYSQRDGLPVLNKDGSLAGIFTKTNLYDALLTGGNLDGTVEPYYNRNVIKISKYMSYDEVIDAVHRIPVGTGVVIDDAGAVVGLFTKVELITALFKEEMMLNTRLKTMYQAMHNALVSVNEGGRINFVNRSAELLFGIENKRVENRVLEEVLPGFDMDSVLSSGKVEIGVNYSCNKIATMVNKTPLLDDGRITGAIAIFQDITDLESIAQEMEIVKRLNQTLKAVLDIGYDALVVVNEEGKVFLVNRVFLDFIKKKEEDVISKPLGTLLQNSRLQVVAKTGVPELNDIQFIDGKPYVVSNLPIIREGRVMGAVGKISFRRVDELRELAGRLEAMDSRLTHFQQELKKARFRDQPYRFEDIVTLNSRMQNVIKEARQAALGHSTVLISGESGVGKELMAQAIHQSSPRCKSPFVKVNCAAIPENLLESEFFGYVQGAFTGAQPGGKQGKLDLANKGTLVLDEIGDMPLSMQGKLLRVLQEQTFERVGGTSTIKVDIRFIAVTNQDLEQKVKEGKFRQDLYYRLNVIPIHILPLRERLEDIPPLVNTFLRKYNNIFGMQVREIEPDALDALRAYSWPGNIRELENMVERAMNFTAEHIIRLEHLPPHMQKSKSKARFGDYDGPLVDKTAHSGAGENRRWGKTGPAYRWKREESEREIIVSALRKTGGNKSEAARFLGISRSWLYEKIKRLNIK